MKAASRSRLPEEIAIELMSQSILRTCHITAGITERRRKTFQFKNRATAASVHALVLALHRCETSNGSPALEGGSLVCEPSSTVTFGRRSVKLLFNAVCDDACVNRAECSRH